MSLEKPDPILWTYHLLHQEYLPPPIPSYMPDLHPWTLFLIPNQCGLFILPAEMTGPLCNTHGTLSDFRP